MATRDNGAVSVGFWNQPNVLVCIDISEAKMVMDEWNHLVFVWEELGDFTVYLNGKEDQKMSKNIPCNTRKGVPLLIGKPSEADEAAVDIEFYAGLVDEVAIYNYAFSKDEIENAMNGQLSGVTVKALGNLAVSWGAIKRE